jgi:hypothetical protein
MLKLVVTPDVTTMVLKELSVSTFSLSVLDVKSPLVPENETANEAVTIVLSSIEVLRDKADQLFDSSLKTIFSLISEKVLSLEARIPNELVEC